MSIRENIAGNIVATLKAVKEPVNIGYVTRDPFDFDKLSNAQYPAVLIQTGDEAREDSTIGDSSIQRMGTITYDIVCYVKSKEIDKARNEIVEAVEEALDSDRTRGGYAKDTQVINIEIDDGSIDPIGGVIISVEVEYFYTRGAT